MSPSGSIYLAEVGRSRIVRYVAEGAAETAPPPPAEREGDALEHWLGTVRAAAVAGCVTMATTLLIEALGGATGVRRTLTLPPAFISQIALTHAALCDRPRSGRARTSSLWPSRSSTTHTRTSTTLPWRRALYRWGSSRGQQSRASSGRTCRHSYLRRRRRTDGCCTLAWRLSFCGCALRCRPSPSWMRPRLAAPRSCRRRPSEPWCCMLPSGYSCPEGTWRSPRLGSGRRWDSCCSAADSRPQSGWW